MSSVLQAALHTDRMETFIIQVIQQYFNVACVCACVRVCQHAMTPIFGPDRVFGPKIQTLNPICLVCRGLIQ